MPKNFGGETHLVIKAYPTGRKTAMYHDLILREARRTGRHHAPKNQHKFGRAGRALGLSWYYSVRRYVHGRSQITCALYRFTCRYLTKTDAYEHEVRS